MQIGWLVFEVVCEFNRSYGDTYQLFCLESNYNLHPPRFLHVVVSEDLLEDFTSGNLYGIL